MKFPDSNEGKRALKDDIASHPNLVELTRQDYVHTETYGRNGEVWYLTREDGSYRFYNVQTDVIISDKPLEPFDLNYTAEKKKVSPGASEGSQRASQRESTMYGCPVRRSEEAE